MSISNLYPYGQRSLRELRTEFYERLLHSAQDDPARSMLARSIRTLEGEITIRLQARLAKAAYKPTREAMTAERRGQGHSPTQVFSIWSEGYSATGQSATAQLLGTGEGTTFEDACVRFFAHRSDREYFDPKHLSYWGCRLFPNEASARQSFG